MVVKNLRTIVCDLCGEDGDDVTRYSIQYRDGRRTVDLHERHEGEMTLERIRKLVGEPRRGRNTRGQAVVTEAEIARAKKRTQTKKRAAAKKTAKKA